MTLRSRQRGFTLLEVILVVLIFAIMSTMAYGGLNSVLKTRSAVEASIERTADLQRAYMRMRADFQNVMLRPIRDNFGDVQPALLGSRDNVVEFTRGGWRNPLYLARSSFERVVYRLSEHRLERASYRVLDRAQDSVPGRFTLLDRVDEFRLRYYSEQREWVDQWPVTGSDDSAAGVGNAKPPRAVEITLVTHDLGKLVFLFKSGSEGSVPQAATLPPTGKNGTNGNPTVTTGSGVDPGIPVSNPGDP